MKAIIFDVDDVLIDAGFSRIEKYRIVCKKLKIQWCKEIRNILRSEDYSGVNWVADQLNLRDKLRKDFLKLYGDGVELDPKWYPEIKGTKEQLKRLSKKYVLVAYSAAKEDETRKKLQYNDLLKYLSFVVCGNQGDSNSKENTIKQAIAFLNNLRIDNKDIAIVDDRVQAGIVLGKKFGLYRVRFNYGIHSHNEFVPDRVIKSLKELK